ncbi:hypothetical protein [Rubinisphaera brasiliensis]|uniref:Pericardin like protein n=1 Tax=Rubinisphaera brasiliensis (strain ATCC 49424 / DSM 5305 / JCM 21570 / IAM 15109 / NBRC 103401 / IFAM 1448) TaxID=756272 RepID=F0ST66_RUBBR|nr:hypothetical protein [Rubinisphaera brasiliensis]ADY59277.1 pericardin like protein [Rubinisphaera brasiliensis DSM 5305]
MISPSWRKQCFTLLVATTACLMAFDPIVAGLGGRGGGGGGRPGGGGGGRVGGGGGARPSISAPSRPSVSRPSPSRPSVSRPSPSRPTPSRPSVPSSRPSPSRPSGGFSPSLPSRPSGGSSQRPNIQRPNIQPPGGGQRPNVSIPNLPSSRPSLPSGNRPSTLPGNTRPSLPSGNRPTTRPGGDRPTTLPGGNRPSLPTTRPDGDRPTTLPGTRPGGDRPSTLPGGNRPNLPGNGNRPGTLPSRPGYPGGGGSPKPGDLGDFLGIDKPLRPSPMPELPSTRPGGGNRPGGGDRPVTLPGDGDRPVTLPGEGNRPGNRPGIGDRPGTGDRPGIGDRPGNRPGLDPDNRPGGGNRPGNRPDWINRPGSGNNVINNRPNWVNINNSTNININNRWSNAIRGPGRPVTLPAERRRYWNTWGGGVRGHWDYHRYHGCFNSSWWNRHPYPLPAWRCPYYRYPYSYWWRRPAWTTFGTWFVWSNTYANSWSQPVYYDYGSGGNVVYQGDTVYINEQPVASSEDFAMSAASLATVPPPESPEVGEEEEWMPLGTFALSTDENDVNPTRVVQLVINKQGIVSGTLYNTQTDQAQAVQGQVDKQTQRVAFRIGDNEDLVAETGLYNLTQDEVPVLVHFGTEKTETYLLIRLDEPADDGADSSGIAPPQPQ